MSTQEDTIKKTVSEMFAIGDKEASTLADFVRKNLSATEKLVCNSIRHEDWPSIDKTGKGLQEAGKNLKMEKLIQGGQALCQCADNKDGESARRVAQKIDRVVYTYVSPHIA